MPLTIRHPLSLTRWTIFHWSYKEPVIWSTNNLETTQHKLFWLYSYLKAPNFSKDPTCTAAWSKPERSLANNKTYIFFPYFYFFLYPLSLPLIPLCLCLVQPQFTIYLSMLSKHKGQGHSEPSSPRRWRKNACRFLPETSGWSIILHYNFSPACWLWPPMLISFPSHAPGPKYLTHFKVPVSTIS